MVQQMTLFGTVVEKGQFFKGLPCADDDTGYYAVVKACGLRSLCVINNFFLQRKGWGMDLGYFVKLIDRKNYCYLRTSRYAGGKIVDSSL